MVKKIVLMLIIIAGLLIGWFNRVTINELISGLKKPVIPTPITRHDITNTYSSTSTNVNGIPPSQLPLNKPEVEVARDRDETLRVPPLPTTLNLKVPFTTQAPFANWGLPYQEACEEASVLTVHYYWQDKVFTPQLADEEIKKIVEFENKILGVEDGYKDTSASTTAWLAEQYWPQYQTKVIYNWTVSDIKSEIATGRPVIIFAYGKALGNPNYRNGGPLYHALVIKGYTPTQFITNDVGTRKGADYIYDQQTIISASHDWNNGDVPNGQRAMLVVWPR